MVETKVARTVADLLQSADTLLITAGAGIGVDSGLPDFRGNEGFWNAYPPYRRLGLSFVEAANPANFERDPAFGWGFYGHRTNLYRETMPHAGFTLMREWGHRLGLETFVVTSNVDGQFQKAGFPEERMLEVHGSIHHLQCFSPCSMNIWSNEEKIPVDLETMRARAIPKCRFCGGLARPNILMFGDFSWISRRSGEQENRFETFLEDRRGRPTVVLELGAGSAVPTIRYLSERLGRNEQTTVVRINPREPHVSPPHHSIPAGSLEVLAAIQEALSS